ncbi:glycine oxidase ThiO [uncultured Pseudokineococcus sp.]|uniref:glycine oxidase ThiO n=1 Tax=uncultured Pseudokineococcus sp. TaxID=1642928 RepID=UPI0026033D0D|nr:glycine oxidase ThiO [uncultured Pseudokineococcus sp.]
MTALGGRPSATPPPEATGGAEAPREVDVVVLGGGVVGSSCAWQLARRGRSVAVCDGDPTRGAWAVAAGMLAPGSELRHGGEDVHALSLAAARGFEQYVAAVLEDSGASARTDLGHRRTGSLALAGDVDDRAVLDDVLELQRALGLSAERLGARACRRLEPHLDPGIAGGVLVEDDHQVDPRRLVAALRTAAGRRGAVAVRQDASVLVEDGRAVGVRLPGGREIRSGVVVLATGAWSGLVDGVPDDALPPVHPVKGQIMRLAMPAGDPLLTRVVRATVRGRPVYLVPREDGELVLGATTEDAGFDRTVTAGAVHDLLRDAAAVLPGTSECELVEVQARPRPGSPDDLPLVGATGVPGLLLATGHARNGVLLSGLTGQVVAGLVTGDGVPDVAALADPTRFRKDSP